jgi:Pyridoxamine 5'-phosphate oxidase
MSPRRDVSMSLEEVNQFLDSSKVAVLTTLGPGGWPHAAGMWYVRSDDTLQMWTYAKSQKARNLMRDERCAVVVESGEQYQELKGVLIRTRALLTDRYEDVVAIGRALYERYTSPRTGMAYDSENWAPSRRDGAYDSRRSRGPAQEIERQAHKRVGILLSLRALASWDHSKLT